MVNTAGVQGLERFVKSRPSNPYYQRRGNHGRSEGRKIQAMKEII